VKHADPVHGSIAAKGLVPLLDVLFQLIFALLVVSGPRTANRAEELLLRLPRVDPTRDMPAPAGDALVIAVDSRGSVRIPGLGLELATEEALDRWLAASLGELVPDEVPEEVTVEIQAEASAPHGAVVELLQHLRLRGFSDVRLAALARAKGGASSEERR
jgi:biopolymer transport protein ExbD